MIGVGIVGLGFMAATHLKALREVKSARLAALCNPSGRHLDGDFSGVTGNVGDNAPLKLDMAGVKAYRSFVEMLADPAVQLVDICAPTLAHPELAVTALRAGKHVLCEKPLARTSQLAREIAASAASAKTFFMPAMCVRFLPSWAWLKAAIDDKRYGRVLSARFERVAEPPGWSQQTFLDGTKSGGALLDLHVHDVDFVQFCFGRPLSVSASGYSKLSGAIDHVVASYRVASGAMVHAEGTWAMTPGFGFDMAYRVNFESATADYRLTRSANEVKIFVQGHPSQTLTFDGSDGYVGELKYLVDCIQAGQPPTLVTATDGVSAVEICEAEAESIRTGREVALAGA